MLGSLLVSCYPAVHVVIRVGPRTRSYVLHPLVTVSLYCASSYTIRIHNFCKVACRAEKRFQDVCLSPSSSCFCCLLCYVYMRGAFLRRSTPRRTASTRSVPTYDVSLFRTMSIENKNIAFRVENGFRVCVFLCICTSTPTAARIYISIVSLFCKVIIVFTLFLARNISIETFIKLLYTIPSRT